MATAYQISYVTPNATDIIHDIRNVFDDHFDRGWAATLVARSGIDPQSVRQLRYLIGQCADNHGGEESLYDLVTALRRFIAELREAVLPELENHLGLRVDIPAAWRSRDDFVHRRMLAYVFPHNVNRLAELTEQLARAA